MITDQFKLIGAINRIVDNWDGDEDEFVGNSIKLSEGYEFKVRQMLFRKGFRLLWTGNGYLVEVHRPDPDGSMTEDWAECALHEASKVFDEKFDKGWTVGGSYYLIKHGLLNRPLHDIDIITYQDTYHSPAFINESDDIIRRDTSSSNKFTGPDGTEICTYKLIIYGVVFDIFYNPHFRKDKNVLDQIITYKQWAAKNCEDPKHKDDLKEIINNLTKVKSIN